MKNLGRIVKKIERKKGAKYTVSSNGLVVETIIDARTIDTIEVKEGHKYIVDLEGNIREIELVRLTLDEFYKIKESGELKKIYQEGKDVEIIEEKANLKEMLGKRIVSVKEAQIGRYIVELEDGKKYLLEGVKI